MSRSAFVMREAKVANEEYGVHNPNHGYGGGDGGGGSMTERLERLEKKSTLSSQLCHGLMKPLHASIINLNV